MATASERLIERLRAMGLDLPADTVVKRTGYGYANRSRGAWTWRLVHDGDDIFFPAPGGSMQCFGSADTVTSLAKAERLAVVRYPGEPDLCVAPWSESDRYKVYEEN